MALGVRPSYNGMGSYSQLQRFLEKLHDILPIILGEIEIGEEIEESAVLPLFGRRVVELVQSIFDDFTVRFLFCVWDSH